MPLDTPLTRAERQLIGGDSELKQTISRVTADDETLVSPWVRVLEADPERVSWNLQLNHVTGQIGGLTGLLEVSIGPPPWEPSVIASVLLYAPGQILSVNVDPDMHLAVDEVWVRYHRESLTGSNPVSVTLTVIRRTRANKEG